MQEDRTPGGGSVRVRARRIQGAVIPPESDRSRCGQGAARGDHAGIMSLSEEIRREFDTLMASGQMERAFLFWKAGNPGLGGFKSVRELIDRSIETEPPEECLSVLCGLVSKHRNRQPKRQTTNQARARDAINCARIILLWLYLPRLLDASKTVRRVNVIGADEIEAELVTGVLEAVSEPGDSDGIGEHLERYAINRLRRAVRRTLSYRRRWEISLSEKTHDDLRFTVSDQEDWVPLLQLAQSRGEVSVRGMQLILLTRHRDLSIEETADALGISPALAYHDRRLAESAFAGWLVTPSEPPE